MNLRWTTRTETGRKRTFMPEIGNTTIDTDKGKVYTAVLL